MTTKNATAVLSKNIRKIRKAKKMTQAQLAKQINKTVEMVCQLESGVSSTKISTLNDIAYVLDVEVHQLFMDSNQANVKTFPGELGEIVSELQGKSPSYLQAVLTLVKSA